MRKILHFLFLLVTFSAGAQERHYHEWYFKTTDSLRIYGKEPLSLSKDTIVVIHGGFGANHDCMRGMAYYNQRVGTKRSQSVDWNFDYRIPLSKNGKVTVI